MLRARSYSSYYIAPFGIPCFNAPHPAALQTAIARRGRPLTLQHFPGLRHFHYSRYQKRLKMQTTVRCFNKFSSALKGGRKRCDDRSGCRNIRRFPVGSGIYRRVRRSRFRSPPGRNRVLPPLQPAVRQVSPTGIPVCTRRLCIPGGRGGLPV